MALLLSLIMFVLGIGVLNSRMAQLRIAQEAENGAVAQELAEAGLEDIRTKLERHPKFPQAFQSQPDVNFRETRFVYDETLDDNAGNPVGTYQVTVEALYNMPPYSTVIITSIGRAGDPGDPAAVRRIRAEFDLDPVERDGGGGNPYYYRFRNRVDGGAL